MKFEVTLATKRSKFARRLPNSVMPAFMSWASEHLPVDPAVLELLPYTGTIKIPLSRHDYQRVTKKFRRRFVA